MSTIYAHGRSVRMAFCLALMLLAVSVAPTFAAMSTSASAPTATAAIPASSCQGTDACTGFTGTVGEDSCNGVNACYGATGTIGNNSCIGEATCLYTQGVIGDRSCTGYIACSSLVKNIGDGSCNGDLACYASTANIGNGSCNAGFTCYGVTANVGDNSCNLDCAYFSHPIGDCQYNGVTPPPCTPFARKQAAVAKLEALLPIAGPAASPKLHRAINNIKASLEVWRWNGTEALNALHGWKVFNLEKSAVSWLWTGPILSNPTLSAAANEAINLLVAADHDLVTRAISATSDPVAIGKAITRLVKADELIAAHLRGPAIYKLRQAWLAVN